MADEEGAAVIVGSILLVVVAAGLLGAGLLRGSDSFYYGSIVASVVAALALVVGVRRLAEDRPIDDDVDGSIDYDDDDLADLSQVGPDFIPTQPVGDLDEIELDPPDEPAAETVSRSQAARVAGLHTEVAVIDGRPRYHLPACLGVDGRDAELVPLDEAVGLGFTPCGQCRPVAAMLSELASS
jgi:hypothetical protein